MNSDEREQKANDREASANTRETVADVRDQHADERQVTADEREAELQRLGELLEGRTVMFDRIIHLLTSVRLLIVMNLMLMLVTVALSTWAVQAVKHSDRTDQIVRELNNTAKGNRKLNQNNNEQLKILRNVTSDATRQRNAASLQQIVNQLDCANQQHQDRVLHLLMPSAPSILDAKCR